jgi:hypothetical protein
MAVQLLIEKVGPLPLQTTFQAPGDGPMFLVVGGSVWSQTANVMIGISISIDDQVVGHAKIFSNGVSTHRAVVPAYIPIKLRQGQHTLKLAADNPQTVSDYNDLYTAVINY